MLSEAKHPAISIKLGSWFGYETDSSSGMLNEFEVGRSS